MTDGLSRFTSDRRTREESSWTGESDWAAGTAENVDLVDGDLVSRSAGGVGEIPDSGNLHAQYDASEISVSDGDGVSTWPEASGNGYDATGGTPIYREGVINGQPVVDFDGSDDYFDTGYNWGTSTSRSIYVVLSAQTSDNRYQYGSIDTAVTNDRTQIGVNPGNQGFVHSYGRVFESVGTPPSGSFFIYGQTSGSGSSEVFVDGTSVSTLSYTSGDNSLTDYIGARNNDGSANNHSDCRIAEILIYQADHGRTTRQGVWDYLNGKYAVF